MSNKDPFAQTELICVTCGITTAAISLLHGHAHPRHELRAAEILREVDVAGVPEGPFPLVGTVERLMVEIEDLRIDDALVLQ